MIVEVVEEGNIWKTKLSKEVFFFGMESRRHVVRIAKKSRVSNFVIF